MSKKVIMNDPRKMSYSPDVNLPPPLAEPESALTTLGSEQFGADGSDYGLNSNVHQRQHSGNLMGSQYDRRKPYHPDGTADIPPSLTELTNNRVAMESEQFENDFGSNNVRNRNKDPNVPSTNNQFLSGMKSVWMTRDTEDVKHDRRLFIKTTIRELVVYCVFLLILCIIAFSMTGSTQYYMTQATTDLFINNAPVDTQSFSAIAQMDDIWGYLDNQFVKALYWDNITNGENMSESNMIFYENKLLGYPRMRMLKVNNKSCEVVNSFRREITQCFGKYSEANEDQTPIGSGLNGTAFEYQSAEILDSESYWGEISTYGGGGFVQDLSSNDPNETLALIAILKENRWIDRGTRVVFIDFSLYNANINLFCIIKLIMELPCTGGVIPTYKVDTMRLIRYVNTFDYVILVCEALFCAFVIYYLIEEVIEIVKWRLSYFRTFWNFLDIIVLVISTVTIYFCIRVTVLVNNKLKELTLDLPRFEDMDKIARAQTLFNNCLAILLFFAWIKIFKYISFNKTMNQLSATLHRSAKDIGGFSVMFSIFFFAYAQFGVLVFGTQVADFSNFYVANLALLRLILGDFDFHAIQNANRILGPIFFVTFVFFVLFVLLNMFLAIINDSYIEVKSELGKQKSELEVSDFISQQYFKALKSVGLTKDIDSIDPQIEFDMWKDELRRRGFTERETNEKFIKHDINGERFIANDQRQLVEMELNNERAPDDPDAQGLVAINGKTGVHGRDCIIIDRRVDQIENAIAVVADRIEEVMAKLEEVEQRKIQESEFGHELDMDTQMNDFNNSLREMQYDKNKTE